MFLIQFYLVIKGVLLWFSIKENRDLGITWTIRGLNALEVASKLTSNTKDDKLIKSTKDKLKMMLELMPDSLSESTINKINNTQKGPLRTVQIGYDKDKGINAGVEINF